jgi:uncharacterized protein
MTRRYYDLNTYLRDLFGCRVQKVAVDAGLTCPNRDGSISREGCIYCNAQGSGTGHHKMGMSITEQILRGQRFLIRRYKARKFIVYFQSFSNTYGPVATLKALYKEALNVDKVVGLNIGTRPDCVSEAVLDLLEDLAQEHLIWVEYGLQSVHDETLNFIRRGHDFKAFCDAVEATRKRGIKICAHVILGLPGEDRQHMLKTARTIAQLGLDGVKLHLLYVVKDTPMADLYQKGAYRCLGMQEYADLVCEFLEYLPPDMVIQRFTSDPHKDELVAPLWALQKAATHNLIHATLEAKDTWQGRRYPVFIQKG